MNIPGGFDMSQLQHFAIVLAAAVAFAAVMSEPADAQRQPASRMLRGLRRAGQQADRPSGGQPIANDLDVLTKLNDDYIQSVQHSNVKRFDEILSDDFLCSNPDGTLIDRKAFLQQTAKPVTIRNLAAHDVNVRLMGDFAIIHARTSYVTANGAEGGGRYTDVWARRNGRWVAVSAHVTRN
jgi:hypothetical protein